MTASTIVEAVLLYMINRRFLVWKAKPQLDALEISTTELDALGICEDDDVIQERVRCTETIPGSSLLEASRLSKVFTSGSRCGTVKSFVAVRDSSFGVNRGDILGLLGPNGAGKTTTMSMITGR